MNWGDGLTAGGGVALFLFSLRYLSTILQRSIARRLRPVIERMLSAPWRCLLMGLALTALVQASSITIVTSMGLLSSGLITLEQGWFLMLGATVGTTLKAWLFAGGIQYAPWLLVLSTALRLSGRQPARREMADVLLAIGLCFLGLSMLSQGLTPVLQQQWVQDMLATTGAQSGLTGELIPVVMGCLLAVVVQSSSAMVVLTITLASHGLLSLTTGAALILGMNIGTTSTELLASAEAGREGRVLAYGHCLIKLLGVLSVLLVFPFYLGLLDAAISAVAPDAGLGVRLAMVHTVFNVGNALVWTLLAGPAVGYLRRLRGQVGPSAGLPQAVRRILSVAPDLAGIELERQTTRLLHLMKLLQDRRMAALMADNGRRSGEEESFAALEETVADLLFALSRRGPEHERPRLLRTLEVLGRCQQLFATWQLLGEHVEAAGDFAGPAVPVSLHAVLERTAARWDAVWLHVLFPQRQGGAPVDDSMLPAWLDYCREQHGLTTESARWMLGTAGLLTSVDTAMASLASVAGPRLVEDLHPHLLGAAHEGDIALDGVLGVV